MAQHLSLLSGRTLKQYGMRSFASHVRAIKKKAQKYENLAGSLRYEKLPSDYKLSEHDSVFLTRRRVGKVYETFEVHYDREKEEVTDIFLVK